MKGKWGQVMHRADRIAIIGSGASLKGADLRIPAGVTAIAVNSAIELLKDPPDFWFTLDPSPANREFMAAENRRPGTVYYAAVPPNFGDWAAQPPYLALPPDDGVIYLRRIQSYMGERGSKKGLSTNPNGVHVGNSGYGALGLAFLMKPQRIALLGIDGTGGYAHRSGGPQPSCFRIIPWLFPTAKPQIDKAGIRVINGSPKSVVKCWPRVAPQEALDWLVTDMEKAA